VVFLVGYVGMERCKYNQQFCIGTNMWRKRQISDEVLKYNQTKSDCDRMLMSMLGSEKLLNQWWESQNIAFDMKQPIEVFNTSESGRQSVFNYLSEHCFGGYH
jgi:uncharacterized protein (DUF2384 family)